MLYATDCKTRTARADPAPPACRINLAGIDFVSVRLVVLCAETGSLSAAARRANLSLSTASHRLSNLEDFFGARLYERDHRGLRATEAGAVFVAHARQILHALDGLGCSLASISERQRAYDAPRGLQKSEYPNSLMARARTEAHREGAELPAL